MPILKPLRKRRGFFTHFLLEQNRDYYQNFLHTKETELLDSVGDILQIELLLYDLRKLYLQTFELEEEGLVIGQQLREQEERLRRLLSVEQTHLTDLELDIAHAKFMIDLLNRKRMISAEKKQKAQEIADAGKILVNEAEGLLQKVILRHAHLSQELKRTKAELEKQLVQKNR